MKKMMLWGIMMLIKIKTAMVVKKNLLKRRKKDKKFSLRPRAQGDEYSYDDYSEDNYYDAPDNYDYGDAYGDHHQ